MVAANNGSSQLGSPINAQSRGSKLWNYEVKTGWRIAIAFVRFII